MNDLIQPPEIDLTALGQYRLNRVRQQLKNQDIPVCIIVSPTNLRYAVDFREYQLFQSHIPMYYLLVPAEGSVVMFGATHRHYPLIDEHRPTVGFNSFDSGFDIGKSSEQFVRQIKDYLNQIGVSEINPVIATERLPAIVFQQLRNAGIELADGEAVLEQARLIKSNEEIKCLKHSINVAETGIEKMKLAMQPGITENQLWSILHQVNIANDGDWMEGRMLASGPRTNPWLQEATHRIMQKGEMVAFDTDMVGPFGYCADISRSWVCGGVKPTKTQQQLHDHALAEVEHNTNLLKPGISFSEILQDIYPRKEEYIAHRYPCFMHGIGMSDEYPKLYYPEDGHRSYEGNIEENMVICVESFTGSNQGGEGVKFEQVLQITANGTELLSKICTAL